MIIVVLFLACVVGQGIPIAWGGEWEGASLWWNVQGPHSPSRTLSVSQLQMYLQLLSATALYANDKK